MNGPKRKKRVGVKPRLEMSALHRLATVFSAVWAVVAKLPEVAKQVSSWVAAPQARLQEVSRELPAAEKQAACWAETWKAPAQVELMASSQGVSHVLAKLWRPPALASASGVATFSSWSSPG